MNWNADHDTPQLFHCQEWWLTVDERSYILRIVEKKAQDDKVSVTLEMPRGLLKQIEAEARDIERPRSWVIRKLLLRALAQNEKTA